MVRRYGPVLEGIYTAIEERQKERQAAIRQQAAAGSVTDKVKQVRAQSRLPLYACYLRGAPLGCQDTDLLYSDTSFPHPVWPPSRRRC